MNFLSRWTCMVLSAALFHGIPLAATQLSGDLPDTLTAANSPYLVMANVFVPSGAKVSMEAGTVLLFRNFTGLHVQGTLLCNGTVDKPVVFTSEFDKTYNPQSSMLPNPYDWNGVQIHEDALGTVLSNTRIMYTVYGIQAMTRFFKLIDNVFVFNGRGNLSINGVTQNVPDNKPFTYALTVRDAQSSGIPVAILSDPDAPLRNTLRFGGLTLSLGGLAGGIYCATQWAYWHGELKSLGDAGIVDENSNLVVHTGADFIHAQRSRNTFAWLTAASFVLSAGAAVGFSWSFTF